MDLVAIQPALPAGGNTAPKSTNAGTSGDFKTVIGGVEDSKSAKDDKKEAKSNGQIAPATVLDLIAALIPPPQQQISNQAAIASPSFGVLGASPISALVGTAANDHIVKTSDSAGDFNSSLQSVLTELKGLTDQVQTASTTIGKAVTITTNLSPASPPNPAAASLTDTLSQIQAAIQQIAPLLQNATQAQLQSVVTSLGQITPTGVSGVAAQPAIDSTSINSTIKVISHPIVGAIGIGRLPDQYGDTYRPHQPGAPIATDNTTSPLAFKPDNSQGTDTTSTVSQDTVSLGQDPTANRLNTLLKALNGVETTLAPAGQVTTPTVANPSVQTVATADQTAAQNATTINLTVAANQTAANDNQVPTAPVVAQGASASVQTSAKPTTSKAVAAPQTDTTLSASVKIAANAGGSGLADDTSGQDSTDTPKKQEPKTSTVTASTATTSQTVAAKAITVETVKSVAGQISEATRDLIAAKRPGTVTVVLQPESLGTVTVTIRQSGQRFEADIQASDAHLRQALIDHKTELVQTVKDQGLKFDQVNVGNGSNGQNGQQLSREDLQRARNLGSVSNPEIPPDNPVPTPGRSDNQLDTRA